MSTNGINILLARHAAKKDKLAKRAARQHIRRRPPRVAKRAFVKALAGTGGILKLIAERLQVQPQTVRRWLDRPDWEDMRDAFDAEQESVLDLAERQVVRAIKNKYDRKEANAMARWYLERKGKERGYGKESTITVEGGDNPLRVLAGVVNIDDLNLPLHIRRKLLEAQDVLEAEVVEQE